MKRSKPKILFILTLPPPIHGANMMNEVLWNSRVQEVFDCTLLDISDTRDINNLGRLDPINVRLALKSLLNLFRLLRKQRFDLVYVLVSQNNMGFFRDGLFILLVRALSKGSKILIHLHGNFFKRFYTETNRMMRGFINLTLKRVDAAIVLGESLREIFTGWIKDVYVVPNGMDILFSQNGRHEKHRMHGNGKVNILFLSNLMKSKGIVDVIKSAVEVSGQYPQVVYKIAGTWGYDFSLNVGPEDLQKEVMDIINAHGLENTIRFLDFVTGKTKEDLLLDADIFVLPSYCDGHPRAIIEAMAAGCPVISTRIGAIPDTIVEKETGFLIDARNPEMLADCIIRLIEDADLQKQMGMSARKRYEQCYTKERFIDNMIGVFQKVINQ